MKHSSNMLKLWSQTIRSHHFVPLSVFALSLPLGIGIRLAVLVQPASRIRSLVENLSKIVGRYHILKACHDLEGNTV